MTDLRPSPASSSVETWSVYVHIPFCRSRCIYCDFVSSAEADPPVARYAQRVVREIEARQRVVSGVPVSVYVGGGTPSLLPADLLIQMLAAARVRPDTGMEVTVEMNPGDADADWLAVLRGAGVNRMSIGVQAMSDGRLSFLGRRHSVQQARTAVADARAAGFENVSVDFIYGTPGQGLQGLQDELAALLALGSDHVSAYELTVAAGTPLSAMGDLVFPDDDLRARMWECVGEVLASNGLVRYEVSNYAKRGKESVHNDHYWDGGLYLGAGAGAHGCLLQDGIRYRYANTPSTGSYLASPDGLPREGIGEGAQLERLGGTDVARELVMLGLRRREGVDVARVLSLVSPSLQPGFENGFCTLVDEGYATRQNQRIVPTAAGMILADELALRFF